MKMIHCMNCMAEMEEERECCPVCGYRRGSRPQPDYALQADSILRGRYLIGNVMGRGGFGITYVGFDLMLNMKVAIKEYFPMGAVSRAEAASGRVSWNSSVVNREAGCESFIKEAQKMAKIDQIPEIVRVRDIFLTNETAYIVMDFVEGETLKEKLKREGVMNARDCVLLLLPVIRGLSRVHDQNMIHRDIKPDNIMIQRDGKVRLLDLGAAKEIELQKEVKGAANGEHPGEPQPTQTVVSNGFSPLEQYSQNGNIGSWTDVYAMCATIWYCLTGKVLPAALDRINHEELPLTPEQKARIPEKMLAVLEKGLALQTGGRIQNMEELETLLVEALVEPGPAPTPGPTPGPGWKKAVIAAAAVVLTTAVVIGARGVAGGEKAKGTCGENLTWTLSKAGELTISGSGDMENYGGSDNPAPWDEYRDSITEIRIGEEVTSIGYNAFSQLDHVQEVFIPAKVSSLGGTFSEMEELAQITVAEENETYQSQDGVLYTADMTTLVQYPRAKEGTSFAVPEGVKSIRYLAFNGCSLEQITLPDTLEAIEEYAFLSCSVESIEIPAGVASIGEKAFAYCSELKTVQYEGETPETAENTFESCTALEETEAQTEQETEQITASGTCGKTLTWSLTESGVLNIDGEGEMEDWDPSQDTYAPWHEYRDSITQIRIGDEITSLGAYAFFALNQVTTLSIPGKVSKVGDQFANMGRCTEITMEENEYFKTVDGVLYTADMSCIVRYPSGKGTSYQMPDGVREIGAFAFTNNELEQIQLADTLETIGAYGFAWNLQLESIEIPASVTKMEAFAFIGCEKLKTVTYQGEMPEIADSAFTDCTALEDAEAETGIGSVIGELLG